MVPEIDGPDEMQMDHAQQPLRSAAIMHGETEWLTVAAVAPRSDGASLRS